MTNNHVTVKSITEKQLYNFINWNKKHINVTGQIM